MSVSSSNIVLVLYHTSTCPYCRAVRKVMKELEMDIELRDIYFGRSSLEELIAEGGKEQVPCLRIDDGRGEVTWLYESSDIIEFLKLHKTMHLKVA